MCPNPKDGGCVHGPKVDPGVFYNNNIGQCTSQQVMESDQLDYVAGTFVWSGFDCKAIFIVRVFSCYAVVLHRFVLS